MLHLLHRPPSETYPSFTEMGAANVSSNEVMAVLAVGAAMGQLQWWRQWVAVDGSIDSSTVADISNVSQANRPYLCSWALALGEE
jgi:hypothetical protein